MTRAIAFQLDPAEVAIEAVRSQGSGGQNVNKVASAAHLAFDVRASSLPELLKERVLARADRRIGADGVIRIKAQQHRSLERNRAAALERLTELLQAAAQLPTPRRATRPTLASQRRRVDSKLRRGQVKAGRGKVVD